MTNAIGYVRVSTDKQENSIDAQTKRIEAAALLKNVELIDIIIDEDEFSGDLDRPGVQRMLEMVRNQKVSAVIITKLDRLTRNTKDAIDLVELFRKKDVALVSIAESLDTESPMGRFFVRMIASFAELEREMIGSRTSEGLQNLKAQGLPAGPAPYGWTAQPRTSTERQLKIRKPLLKNEQEQGIIAHITALRHAGKSLENIACDLNAKGFTTRSGAEWKQQYVRNVLLGQEPAAKEA